MQVLQLGNQLGFCFKAADEIWLVGEFRQDDLYCDLSVNIMLSGKVDRTIGSFTNGMQEIVAFYGPRSVSVYISLLNRKSITDHIKYAMLNDNEERSKDYGCGRRMLGRVMSGQICH